MTEFLPYLPAVLLGALLWRKERQLESTIKAAELAHRLQRQDAAVERAALIEHQDQLLQRIQAPEIATAQTAQVNAEDIGAQFIPPEDFASLNDQMQRVRAQAEHDERMNSG